MREKPQQPMAISQADLDTLRGSIGKVVTRASKSKRTRGETYTR
jgi:hypothetical protein